MFRAVVLRGVTGYDDVEFLDDGARPSKAVYCIQKINRDIEKKRYGGKL